MKKRNGPTLLEKAIETVPEFEMVYKKLAQQVTLCGQSQSTLDYYVKSISRVSLHFSKLPDQIPDEEINEYLCALALDPKAPSLSSFKQTVYGLRYYFHLIGQNKRAIDLPSLKGDTRLPVIFNRAELRELFKAPKLLKHPILLTLVYSAGLRGN